MGERTCRNCFHFAPGKTHPDWEHRGTCAAINATSMPDKRLAQVRPCGNAWLEVAADFACALHLPAQPKDPDHDR